MIKLEKGWQIDVDDLCYTLKEYSGTTTDKNGKEIVIFKNVSYHGTLAEALNEYSKKMVKRKLQEKDMTLSEAIETIEQEIERLKNYIKEETKGV